MNKLCKLRMPDASAYQPNAQLFGSSDWLILLAHLSGSSYWWTSFWLILLAHLTDSSYWLILVAQLTGLSYCLILMAHRHNSSLLLLIIFFVVWSCGTEKKQKTICIWAAESADWLNLKMLFSFHCLVIDLLTPIWARRLFTTSEEPIRSSASRPTSSTRPSSPMTRSE